MKESSCHILYILKSINKKLSFSFTLLVLAIKWKSPYLVVKKPLVNGFVQSYADQKTFSGGIRGISKFGGVGGPKHLGGRVIFLSKFIKFEFSRGSWPPLDSRILPFSYMLVKIKLKYTFAGKKGTKTLPVKHTLQTNRLNNSVLEIYNIDVVFLCK